MFQILDQKTRNLFLIMSKAKNLNSSDAYTSIGKKVNNQSSSGGSISDGDNSPIKNKQPERILKKSSAFSVLNMRTNPSISSVSIKKTHSKTKKEQFEFYYDKCMRGLSHSINIIKALIMRLVFSLHSLIAIIYVYLVKQDEWYFLNLCGVVFLLIELFITIIRRKGKEPRW